MGRHVSDSAREKWGKAPRGENYGRDSIWTADLVERLKELWRDGLTAQEIGRAHLNVSKNAVVAKVRRLKLPMRRPPLPAPPAPPYQIDHNAVTNECLWPFGEPKHPDFHFCGAPAVSGKPYCPTHCAVAYVPEKKKDRAA